MNVNAEGIAGRGDIFRLKKSVDAELSSYKLLVKDDPARSKHIYSIGEQLIEYAAKGRISRSICIITHSHLCSKIICSMRLPPLH